MAKRLMYLTPQTEKITSVASMSAVETKRAIDAAEAAWFDWRNKTGKERASVLELSNT